MAQTQPLRDVIRTQRHDIPKPDGQVWGLAQEAKQASKEERFWDIRAAKYDRLFWTKDRSYIEALVHVVTLKPHHIVLDVGTGTGTVAREIRKHVGHVIAVDVSDAMLSCGCWTGISAIKWDIGSSFFADDVFDRVYARMVFHHILDNLDRAVLRCFDLLKAGGRIVVAEGIPPNNTDRVVRWYSEMFRHKEERLIFTEQILRDCLKRNGFRSVRCKMHIMQNFSVKNWVVNSGLSQKKQETIFALHKDAPAEVKDAYKMRFSNDDCLLETRNAILVGVK
jgi:ubiquinone/menaquinone biosynthesis C-methylase UbiE